MKKQRLTRTIVFLLVLVMVFAMTAAVPIPRLKILRSRAKSRQNRIKRLKENRGRSWNLLHSTGILTLVRLRTARW